ncbi:MAG: alkaline phosphatase D family protein [Pirellulales bacterium]|nr:alkaline phosphatase D family protein [Pirellulales bacterium]
MTKYLTCLLTACLLILPSSALGAEKPPSPRKANRFELLKYWCECSPEKQQIYKSAHKFLAARPDASFADLAGNAEFQRLCEKNKLTHLGGPMLGNVGPEGISVWMRTIRPAAVEVRIEIDGKEKTFGPVQSTLASDLSAVVRVDGLEPNKSYTYRVLVDGEPIDIPKNAAIRTAPADGKQAKTRIVFGSCSHRWGLGNRKQSDLIRSRRPTAMLLCGDISVQDRNNHFGLHRADYLLRDFLRAWQDLAADVPVYAAWDDHDYFDNDLAGIPEGFTDADRRGVRQVFTKSWNNPAYGFGDDGGGIFFRTRIGPCDVIMLDSRYFRANRKGSFLGKEQMKWLKRQLLDCRGPFIIISCGTMWSDYVSKGKDSWGRWDKAGRERIFKLIEDNRIGGVLLISGDRHGARGFRIPRDSGFAFHEFEAASLGAHSGPPETKPEWNTQFYHLTGQFAFGEFTFDTQPADPQVEFRLIRDDGKIIHEMKLTRSQLTPPGPRKQTGK